MISRRFASAALGIALVCALIATAVVVSDDTGVAQAGPDDKPNIVVVMSDDQPFDSMELGMPRTTRWLRRVGTDFNNSIVTTPLCCPSRATFITGEYGHNNGVRQNNPGYPDLNSTDNVLPVWMQNAGYTTALVGKYLNGYAAPRHIDAISPAPGWDDWRAMIRTYSYRGYRLGLNGEARHFGRGDGSYLTNVLTRQAVEVVRDEAAQANPLFLWVSHYAPHPELGGSNGERTACYHNAIPDRQDRDVLGRVDLPRSESFFEEDVTDKPSFIRALPGQTKRKANDADDAYRCQIASLGSLDRSVMRIKRELEETGELDNTVFVFTSDNGFIHGQHRITNGKGSPYEESIRVPLLIAAPRDLIGGEKASEINVPVANVDLAATILDFAGGEPCTLAGTCRALDGRSLAPLLSGDLKDWPADRAIVIEADDGRPCAFRGVRTTTFSYFENGGDGDPNGKGVTCAVVQPELYDLSDDPLQLRNILSVNGSPQADDLGEIFGDRLDTLRNCSGTEERPAPGRTPCE